MADLYINGVTTSKARSGNNQRIAVTGTRDGAIYTCDWILAAALEGRLFHTQVGTVTTPVATKVVMITLQPELVIDVPSGTTIVPVEIAVYLETFAGTLADIVAMTSTALRGAGTSTVGAALSTRTDRVVSSTCSIYHTYSGNAVAVAGTIEFWRYGEPWILATAEGNPTMKFEYSVRKNTPQVVVGPGSVSLCIGATGTGPTGYWTASWVEMPSSST